MKMIHTFQGRSDWASQGKGHQSDLHSAIAELDSWTKTSHLNPRKNSWSFPWLQCKPGLNNWPPRDNCFASRLNNNYTCHLLSIYFFARHWSFHILSRICRTKPQKWALLVLLEETNSQRGEAIVHGQVIVKCQRWDLNPGLLNFKTQALSFTGSRL